MLPQPIDALFASPRRVLVAGAGGGFDVVAGLPIALALHDRGHEVHLASYSFTRIESVRGGNWVDPYTLEMAADATLREGYAPEIGLAQWIARAGLGWRLFCFRQLGVRDLAASYGRIVQNLAIDAIILVDGGVDAVMRGDENSLGTPTFDAISLSAVRLAPVAVKVLALIGFGAERHDRISHAQVLGRLGELTGRGALLGVEAFVPGTPVADRWHEALEACHEWTGPIRRSIVCDTIGAALRGEHGDVSVNRRTVDSPIWVSSLALLAWYLDIETVASTRLYDEALASTNAVGEAADVIEAVHAARRRPPETIPI